MVAFCLAVSLGVGHAYAAEFVVQSTETTHFPRISLTLTLPSAAGGQVPKAVKVWENGVELPGARIRSLAEDRQPLDAVLVVDTSGSMQGRPLSDAQSAARRFIQKMGPNDRIAVVAFSSSPRVVSGFTNDRAALDAAIGSLGATGETALYDGVVKAAGLFNADTTGRRAIVVLSDGKDTVSSAKLGAAVDATLKGAAPVYAVALRSSDYDPKALGSLASASGGRLTSAKDSGSLVGIYGAIAEELQSGYEVSFTSKKPNTPDLEYRMSVEGAGTPLTKTIFITNPTFSASAVPFAPLSPKTALEVVMGMVTQSAIVALCGICAALLGYGVLLGIIRGRRPIDELHYYDRVQTRASAGQARAASIDASRNRVVDLVDQVAAPRGFTGLVRGRLERAGLPLRPNEYILLHVTGVLFVGLLAELLTRNDIVSGILVLAATALPILALNFAGNRRRKQFEAQLPDILALMSGSLRAGWGLQQSMDLVGQQAAEPAASEFKRVQAEVQLGLPLDAGLARLAERIGSSDFQWTASAIAIQREVGGNLAEVLETLAATIRERAELYREVSALTAEGRFSAIILVALPFFLGFFLYLVQPVYMNVMFSSIFGLFALGGGLLLLLVGVIWLVRVVNIDV